MDKSLVGQGMRCVEKNFDNSLITSFTQLIGSGARCYLVWFYGRFCKFFLSVRVIIHTIRILIYTRESYERVLGRTSIEPVEKPKNTQF